MERSKGKILMFEAIPDFFWRALIGGVGVAIVAGPLGALMVWRRMAYFGDTLAHAGLLGVTLALALHIHIILGVLLIGIMMSTLLFGLQKQSYLSSDTALGILSHGALAVGLISIATIQQQYRVNLLGLLYGDILAISWQDVLGIYLGCGFVLLCLVRLWRPLLSATVAPDLAAIEGVPVARVRYLHLLLLAIVVAIAMKIVGVLLITALLIIPVATARRLAGSPEQLAILASLTGSLCVLGGLLYSWSADVPTGPAIVVVATAFFIGSLFLPKRR
jgi:zinc transport system permease protein